MPYIKSPYPVVKKQKPTQALGLEELFKLWGELGTLKTNLETLITRALVELERAKTIQKGDKGDVPSLSEVLRVLKPFIPAPIKGDKGDKGDSIVGPKPIAGVDYEIPKKGKDGRTPVKGIDYFDGKDGVSPNIEDIISKIFEDLSTSKRKIKLDNIEGLKSEISSIRNATMRGGGDTVAAGTGVTITQNNGVKTISASGSGVTFETPSGTVDGSNKTFTATQTPKYVVVDGVTYFENDGYTLAGLVITTTVAPTGFIRDAY